MLNKKFAFTLAEVLIVLGIIGVVSALTLPALIQSWQNKAYVSQLHKVYNEFQQSFLTTMNDESATNLSEAGFVRNENCEIEKDFLHSHFKVVKDCGTTNASECFAPEYTMLDGSIESPNSLGYAVTIATGASIQFYIDGLDLGDEDTDDYLGYIVVDSNGLKKPNKGGRDFFRMFVYADGVLDDYEINPSCRRNKVGCPGGKANASEAREFLYTTYCLRGDSDAIGCFGKLLNDNWEIKDND